ncbi:helix-turn-helix domain-containing protein [Bifidobacterium panos]|uniref:XRE family transcriptional regulator n=1 Tax=Bifidobacterium panos TaxID=2675321 RepID=A0ABX1SXZ5_9BIFI|nr:helix-turn-helix transcriptional regulator [Bifidobacterium sp. DSM 109963]NMN02230.1 XRE family transcriptional regulator [Bifidobacterium sp. DSM 109963]
METMTRVRSTVESATSAPMVRPGAARMRELTPAQRRAVMFAQQQVLKARAAKKAKDEAIEARRRMWDESEADIAAAQNAARREESRHVANPTLRGAIGYVLRDLRSRDHRTLREVSEKAGVSLGYLSEVERGQKEASSELLTSIAESLGVSAAQLLRMVADRLDVLAA